MPYIIRTTTVDEIERYGRDVATLTGPRVAVATLDEAREHAADHIDATEYLSLAYDLPERGGTIGPLPDGTVITVEPMTWAELSRVTHVGGYAGNGSRILDTYNRGTN